MNDLISTLGSNFLSKNIESVANSIGLPKEVTAQAMKIALPAMIEKMGENTKTEDGAASLFNALKSHDGSVLNNVETLAKNPDSVNASGILKHVFGDKQSELEKQIGQSAGLDSDQAQKILKVIAPMVMGSLGKAQNEGMDISSMVSGLSSISGSKGSLLTSFLDKNGDGDIKDDLLKMGMNHIKNKFLKKN